MKKRYLILAGLLVMTVAAAGCGKKKTTETAPVEVTATPTPEVTKAVDMVDMQQTADEDIKNIMGEKTSTASKIVFVNNTCDPRVDSVRRSWHHGVPDDGVSDPAPENQSAEP